ncbi:type II toxin-antitoxin system RelB family antitoxin [Burkholderia sp. WTPI3]|uniref:type II toxin-antitoxin system RelB family antitoxin n=1 Tax=Burkholderia sp. WTPI3 TaxID=2822167 RepID=UPI001F3255D4|nr:stability determinant [Burkholderia sp. WTPI3]
MNAILSPIESEFTTAEEAEAYDRWLRAEVQASLDDPAPNVPHDKVMGDVRALLAERKAGRKNAAR